MKIFSHMLDLFRHRWTLEETMKVYPHWERSVTVCLCTKWAAELVANGIPEETSRLIAAQGVNYITGADWEAVIQTLPPEKRLIIEAHKSEVVPSIRDLLAKDRSCREIVIYFLRIKSTVMLVAGGASDEKVKNIEISDDMLEHLGVTRADYEDSKKMLGGYAPKWMKDPMKARIDKILLAYGTEFPEGPDPGKFSVMVLNLHHKIFPQKHA